MHRLLTSEPPPDAAAIQDELAALILRDDGLTTYMLIDGPCRKDALGAFDLGVVGKPVTPLFNPGGAGAMSPLGAYIVDLDLARKTLSASAFRRQFLSPWGYQHSVCMRTSQTASNLCRHLRKFLKLRRADSGQQVYLRFWDSRVALPYFSGLVEHPARLAEWLRPRKGDGIEELIFETNEKWLGWRARSALGNLSAGPHAIKPELSLAEIAILKEARLAAFDRKVAIGLWDSLKGSVPSTLEDAVLGTRFVRMAREEAGGIGIFSEQGVARYAAVCMALGLGFTYDPAFDQNQLAILGARGLSESERLAEARELILCQESQKPRALEELGRWMSGAVYGNPQETLARIYSCRIEPGTGLSGRAIFEQFLGQDTRLSRLDDRRLDLAVSMAGAFGFFWPRNPLYAPYLDEVCDRASALPKLRKYLLHIGTSEVDPGSIWEVAAI